MRDESTDITSVIDLVRSHSKLALKTKLILAILDQVKADSSRSSQTASNNVNAALRKLATLESR
jgi:acetyl-CoA carboxylase/biotin carboxylase 1